MRDPRRTRAPKSGGCDMAAQPPPRRGSSKLEGPQTATSHCHIGAPNVRTMWGTNGYATVDIQWAGYNFVWGLFRLGKFRKGKFWPALGNPNLTLPRAHIALPKPRDFASGEFRQLTNKY